jgi:Holliday junction resolvase RusA-like endonuclease
MTEARTVRIEIPGEPRSKARPRFTGGGKVYSSKEQRAHEDAIAWAVRAKIGNRPFLGNVQVEVWFYRSNKQRIDLDNLLKSVLDGANGIAWRDDVQVTSIGARLHLDPQNPRTILILRDDEESTMPRGTAVDLVATCETCGRDFTWRRYESASREPRFCSNACRMCRPRWCVECGAPFRTRSGVQQLCSKRCRMDAKNRARREALAARWSEAARGRSLRLLLEQLSRRRPSAPPNDS